MFKKPLIIIFFTCFILTGCEKRGGSIPANDSTAQTEKADPGDREQTEKENSVIENINEKNYETYSGSWTERGISHDKVISDGGIEFTVTIADKNELNGYLYSQQGTSERIAEIENITGKIINNECYYEFWDDGWGGTGILHIQFLDNTISIEVQNYKMDESNLSGFGISGLYQLVRADKGMEKEEPESVMSEQNIIDAVYDRYYSRWSDDEMLSAIEDRSQYRKSCSFYEEVSEYMERDRNAGDIAAVVEPLYYSDMMFYQKKDFENVPLLIIHLAKNEIYAGHGYIFEDEDLNNYFKGQLWYDPSVRPEDFDESVFNEYEKANLKLLSGLDTYKQTGIGAAKK
ncbi:YARHG domain-containing protein [Lachnospiraceae bacterium 54-53]